MSSINAGMPSGDREGQVSTLLTGMTPSQADRRKTWRSRAGRNVLIVGSGSLGRKLSRYLEQKRGDQVIGFVDEICPAGGGIATLEHLSRLTQREFVDQIIVAAPQQRALTQQAIQLARDNHLDVKMVPDLCGFQAINFEALGNIPVLTLYEQRQPRLGLLIKRIGDFMVALAALAIASPLLAMVALIIKLESHGPVLYVSPRAGRNGRHFNCCKFRTMVADADSRKQELRQQNQRAGPIFKIANDPRITRIGKFLRRYSLDELPQLWNVVTGDMSLVGPRPHPMDDFERYELDDFKRLKMTPGLTGLWQVTARRDSSFSRNMELDLQYIRQWSLWLDLRILCRTIPAVLKGSGT